MNIYVDKNVPIDGNGQKTHPFKTIQAAANIAQPGDTVLVAPGIYRGRPPCLEENSLG